MSDYNAPTVPDPSGAFSTAKPIPKRLKNDAIIEAIFEMRFDTGTLPDILVGRLSALDAWKGMTTNELPARQLPPMLREMDANLRFAPVIELRDEANRRLVRIGPHVLSYHQLAPYVGWEAFKPQLALTVDALFSTAERLSLRRLGFRYMNAWRADVHQINAIGDLDLNISVDGQSLTGNVNLNFTTPVADDSACTVRIATTDFAQGTIPPATSVIVDVDVFTTDPIKVRTKEEAVAWLDAAHAAEKTQCFRLLRTETIRALREE